MDELVANLRGILSPHEETRNSSERALNEKATQSGYGAQLAQIIATPVLDSGTRQAACSALKRFISEHWQEEAENFQPPLVAAEEKRDIRRRLLESLREQDKQVGSSICISIQKVAELDWPQEWPELTEFLTRNFVQAEDVPLRQGSLRCLTFISEDIEEPQLSRVAPDIVPQLVQLLERWQDWASDEQLSGALAVLRNLMERASMANEGSLNNTAAVQTIQHYFPHFLRQVNAILNCGLSLPYTLTYSALRVVLAAFNYYPKDIHPFAPSLLTSCWNLFQEGVEPYLKQCVLLMEARGQNDSESETSIASVVLEITELLSLVVSTERYRSFIEPSLQQMLELCLKYAQPDAEEQESVDEQPSAAAGVVEHEDWTVRDCLAVVVSELAESGYIETVLQCCGRAMKESLDMKEKDASWWLQREASLTTIIWCADAMEASKERLPASLQPEALIRNILECDLQYSGAPSLLHVRAFALIAEFRHCAHAQVAEKVVDMALKALESDSILAVRIAAVRAAASHVGLCSREHVDQHAVHLGKDLSHMMSQENEETQRVVVESLGKVFHVSQKAIAQVAPQVAPQLLQLWEKYFNDPLLGQACNETIKRLCSEAGSAQFVHQLAVPPLIQVLENLDSQPLGLPDAALDLLDSILSNYEGALQKAGVMEGSIRAAFPVVAKVGQQAHDRDTVESASSVLRAMMRACGENLANIVSQCVEQILGVAARILQEENGSPKVVSEGGNLLSQLIRRMPRNAQPYLNDILKAAAMRLKGEENALVCAALAPVLARMVLLDANGFVNAFNEIHKESGEDLLQPTLETWLSAQNDVQGSANIRLTASALARLSAMNNDHLNEMMVKGQPVHDANEGIRTRSKTRSQQKGHAFVQVPFFARALDIVADAILEYEEGEAEVEPDEDTPWQGRGGIEDLMFQAEDEEDEDPDLADDPNKDVDLKECIRHELQARRHRLS